LRLKGKLQSIVDQYNSKAIPNCFVSSRRENFCLNMVGGEDLEIDYDDKERKGDLAVKIICLGDSAVGKSK